MIMHSRLLASGDGWSAQDLVCCAGPADRPFEERHDLVCVAAVTEGTFEYRTANGTATLAPGALLLGNAGHCFQCSHKHASGDRCLSFHYAPDWFDDIAAALPGMRRSAFGRTHLPPSTHLLPLIAGATAARDALELEEIALRLAVAALLHSEQPDNRCFRAPSARDRRRVVDTIRVMEEKYEESFTLAQLAASACMSPYHFLRVFRQVAGTTPHQFLMMRRLNAVAVRLRTTDLPIAVIAFEAGFGDLSTFNRRFRGIMGTAPGAYRRARITPPWLPAG